MRPATFIILIVVAGCGGGGAAGPDAAPLCEEGTATCEDDTLIACTGGALESTDCAETGLICGDVGDGAACMDECTRQGVDEVGLCADGGVRRCDAGAIVVTPCGADTHCETRDGAAACVSDACLDVGPLGRCDGDTLVTCDGAPVETDCANGGQVCAFVSDTVGYGCRAPETVGTFVVSGTVRYEDRPPLATGHLGAITPRPVRGARVSIVLDSAPTTAIASVLTADDGTYRLHYTATADAQVHVLAAARDPWPGRPLAVVNRQGVIHGQAAPSFAAAPTATSDVLATEANGTAQAFNILDELTRTMDLIRYELGDDTPRGLTTVWAVGSTDGTYYDGQIHLVGEASDDDGYDDTVILHESGHYVEDTQGRSDNPGGFHDGSPADPNLAWSEGFSTYLAMVIYGEPIYMDTNVDGGWSYNADFAATYADPEGDMGQLLSESTVNEILWDLGDGGDDDDDPYQGVHGPVLRVQPEYLRLGSFRLVGEQGADLVDFLDGLFLSQGLGLCYDYKLVVTYARHFPYDYAGPAGECPF